MNPFAILLGLVGAGAMRGLGKIKKEEDLDKNSTEQTDESITTFDQQNVDEIETTDVSEVPTEPLGASDPALQLDPIPSSDTNSVPLPSFNPEDYDHVFIGETFNSTLSLDAGFDNTLIINCTFQNIEGSGIELRNVSNVVIYDNEFSNIDGTAVRFRSSGSTEDCYVLSNDFDQISKFAISVAKRYETDVDHEGLVIGNNTIGDIGLLGGGSYHAIYVQASDVSIFGNEIIGSVDGNGISIRGDGQIWDNYIDITSNDTYGSGIKYYSDHLSGESKTLEIYNNTVIGNSDLYSGIEIKATPDKVPDSFSPSDWMVNNFYIYGNTVSGAENDYVIDPYLENASWTDIFIDTGNTFTSSAEFPVVDQTYLDPTGLTDEMGEDLEAAELVFI